MDILSRSISQIISQTIDARNSLTNQNSLQVKKKLDFSRLSNPQKVLFEIGAKPRIDAASLRENLKQLQRNHNGAFTQRYADRQKIDPTKFDSVEEAVMATLQRKSLSKKTVALKEADANPAGGQKKVKKILFKSKEKKEAVVLKPKNQTPATNTQAKSITQLQLQQLTGKQQSTQQKSNYMSGQEKIMDKQSQQKTALQQIQGFFNNHFATAQ